MKNNDNMKVVAFNNRANIKNVNNETEKEEDKDIIVKIGKIIYRFKKGDPEWEDWNSVPSYDDSDMVYALMLGAYVVEYKRLIPNEIKSVIKDECAPSSNWSRKFNEAYKIYKNICHVLGLNNSDKAKNREDAIFERFYDLLYEVVSVFYKKSFYNQSKEHFPQVKLCQEKYDALIHTLQNYSKTIETVKCDTAIACNKDVELSVERLIRILNELIKVFYERALEYGAYFREFDIQFQKKLS